MPVTEKQRRRSWDTTRPNYAVYRRRRKSFVVLLMAVLTLGGLGIYLFSSSPEETSDEPSEQVAAPAVERQVPEERADDEEEAETAITAPEDPTLYLTVPRLGLYGHTVRNDRSEAALDLGAIKLPETGFPWQKEDTNTYIACHRLGWPGTESFNQCLNLPSMQKGDEILLGDTNGTTYRYRVSDILIVSDKDTWVTKPLSGRDVVSLQTCIENPNDVFTLGPNWTARYIVQAVRVG